MRLDPKEIEPKWQRFWEERKIFAAEDKDQSRPKYYILDMFPYPSAAGLHVGHPEGYTATDILARFKKMSGYNVLHPMGFDAFGLPAENYAIKTGVHPRKSTENNVDRIREQIKRLGFSYDWGREVNTTDPEYYKWTQWIFLKLFEQGLAYQATIPINWCPSCRTGLANEEVKGGRCERCSHEVTRKGLRQWMLKITAYAERLLSGLDDLDWPEPIKKMQQEWIGRSTGADVFFEIVDPPADVDSAITVYTTRPDTLFGATYMVLAPEHPLVSKLTTPDCRQAVEQYIETAALKSDLQRTDLVKKKTGVFIGAYATNPVNNKKIPIWIADYVLMGYGTGAIMAVPAHDQRDYEFAKTFDLPIVEVVRPPSGKEPAEGKAYVEDGLAINSGEFNSLTTAEFKEKIAKWLSARKKGEETVRYKLRDWVFSRQRYWGEPIPIVHCEACGVVPVPEDQLPVLLPEVERFEPTGTGESPLAALGYWVKTTCPKCKGPGHRETNTMPQWAGSCWYYLRYLDNKNSHALVDAEKERYWMPVDLYVGGAEHAVLHLMYARFWHMVLYDLNVVSTPEPFSSLRNQGMILGISYRYLQDEEKNVFPTSDGNFEEDRWSHKSTGNPLVERWVPTAEVHWKGDSPRHPEHPELELEAFTTKMSKSRGNVVNPDEIIEQYGADVMRFYEMFMGPFEASCPWNARDIEGVNRFLHRSWRLFGEDRRSDSNKDVLETLRHKVIKKVTHDIETMNFNTAIAQLMTYVNEQTKQIFSHPEDLRTLALLMSPFAPHFAEEVWSLLGHKESIFEQQWPKHDEAMTVDDMAVLVVQVNGKKRGTFEVPVGVDEKTVLATAKELVRKHVAGKQMIKEIYVPRANLVNLVVKQ
ncbi:MAG: leucine--tRNA ligase [Pseudomonadota bacterium]